MIKVPDNLPIEKHFTMEIADSSKIQAYQACPRGFFFNYVLGLRPSGPQIHLDFGSAWHEAMETLLLYGYSEQAQQLAMHNFMEVWRQAYPNEAVDDDYAPKNPYYASKGLEKYAKQYESDDWTVLYTETSGLVPISQERDLVVKLDSIIKDNRTGTLNSMEHKTTGRNSMSWREKWAITFQVEAYTHALYVLFPILKETYDLSRVGSVIINGAVFTKGKIFEGIRINVHKTKEAMLQFQYAANFWINMIEFEYEQLAKSDPNDPVMQAFPINCQGPCAAYGCRMGGLCAVTPNPLKYAEKAPPGYSVEYWNPLRNVEESENVIKKDEQGNLMIDKRKDG